MIDLNNLFEHPSLYKEGMKKRWKDSAVVDELIVLYEEYKLQLRSLEDMRAEKNTFSKQIWNLTDQEREEKMKDMKELSEKTKILSEKVSWMKSEIDKLLKKIPNVLSKYVPVWNDDNDNLELWLYWNKPYFDFEPKPYWELPVYKKYVWQEEWVKAMWTRWYYMRWEMARFQKVLFDYALDYIMSNWYELFYVPLMLNSNVLTWTWHLPDFDWQQYEVPINESTSFYLIWSSEPSIMWYYLNENVWDLETPIKVTCLSSCFRKESWSYWKDQQWILRVHQFDKVEMVVICRPEHAEECFQNHARINEAIFNSLWIHFRKVEVCTWDMPGKHYRQQDYEAYFPWVDKFREIWSNWNASDFQNRWLWISYKKTPSSKAIPWWLNDTWITFRVWLAIMEQNQTEDWKVKIPTVLVDRFWKKYLE